MKDFDENNKKKDNLGIIKKDENLNQEEKKNEKVKNLDEIKDDNIINDNNVKINNEQEISLNKDLSFGEDNEAKDEKQNIKQNEIGQINDNSYFKIYQTNQQQINNVKEEEINNTPKEIDSIDKKEEKDKLPITQIEQKEIGKNQTEEQKEENLKDLPYIKNKDLVGDELELNKNSTKDGKKIDNNDKKSLKTEGKIESSDKPVKNKNISKIVAEFLDNLTNDILKKIEISQ